MAEYIEREAAIKGLRITVQIVKTKEICTLHKFLRTAWVN